MQPRKLYIDTQNRSFVASPKSNIAAGRPQFFDEDVEAIEIYFLYPTNLPARPYDFVDFSGSTIKLAVGLTQPAALATSWSAISPAITTTITSLVTGGAGTNAQQQISFSKEPVSGGWAIQFPSRNITVSSVSANVFTAANHGLYSGQSVTLTAFSLTNSTVANGSSYYVIRNSGDTFSLASTSLLTTELTAQVTGGGGIVEVPAITTGQLAFDASPQDIQNAIASAGFSSNGSAQISVTGTRGVQHILTYGNGSSNRDYANVIVVGSTLLGERGFQGQLNLSTSEIAELVASGDVSVKLEIEATDDGKRQTYQMAAELSADIVSAESPIPLPSNTANSFNLSDGDGGTWTVTIDSDGVLTTSKV